MLIKTAGSKATEQEVLPHGNKVKQKLVFEYTNNSSSACIRKYTIIRLRV